MASTERTVRGLHVLVAFAAGLLGATLAQRDSAPCGCSPGTAAPIVTLPEVEVVATRLPP